MRDYESMSTRNLNAILICLAFCSSSDKLSTEYKKEKTRSKTCEYEWNVHIYYKSNLVFENKVIAYIIIYQFKTTDPLSVSEGQRPDCD